VIKDANKEGKLKLLWGEGTLGGTKGAAKFEQMMNKMFGTDIRISFTPGAAMPQVGSQIALNTPRANPPPRTFTSAPTVI
jgi:hypothetical protein